MIAEVAPIPVGIEHPIIWAEADTTELHRAPGLLFPQSYDGAEKR